MEPTERWSSQRIGGLRLTWLLVCLPLVLVLSGCLTGVTESPLAARVAATPIPGDPQSTGPSADVVRGWPAHDELQVLADTIADALAVDDRLSAVKALNAERATGYDCRFRATFNGHAPFPSVEKAEAEARETAAAAKPTHFAVATRNQSAGVLGVLVMAWCPERSSRPSAGSKS